MCITQNKKALQLYRIRVTLVAAVRAFLCGIVASFNIKIGAVMFGVTIILYFTALFLYLPVYIKKYILFFRNGQLISQKWVFYQNRSCISKSKIQHTEIICTPLQKFLGLRTLIFRCAGAKIRFSSIPLTEAEELLKQIGDDCVEI